MIRIDGSPLQMSDIAKLARREARLDFSDNGSARRSCEFAQAIATQRIIYGRQTGVGANRNIELTDQDGFAAELLRSHATSGGTARAADRIRAMLVVRLNQLAAGGSGAHPDLLCALASMIAADALPDIREHGGIGSADLAALARTALTLQGELRPGNPLPVPYSFTIGDALAFLSSNAAAIGDAALAVSELSSLARATMVVASLTFRAVRGNHEAFGPPVEHTTPFEGTRHVCRAMRELIGAPVAPARIQDSYGLRTLPQVHGAVMDRVAELAAVVSAMTAAPAENPVFLPEVGVAHHGGFAATHLSQALDAARSAAAQSAQLSVARLAMLVDPQISGLTAFLAERAGSSGIMVAEYVAASALSRLRALAMPTAMQSAVLSGGTEDDASFASLGAVQALECVPVYRTVVACELVAAVRALRMRGENIPTLTEDLPLSIKDRDLTDDISQADQLLDELATTISIPPEPIAPETSRVRYGRPA
jgi:histidine ammonia-lyase